MHCAHHPLVVNAPSFSSSSYHYSNIMCWRSPNHEASHFTVLSPLLRYKNLQFYNKEFPSDCSKYEPCRVLGTTSCNFVDGDEIRNKIFNINKNPTRCNSTQSDLLYCKITVHVSGHHRTHHQEY